MNNVQYFFFALKLREYVYFIRTYYGFKFDFMQGLYETCKKLFTKSCPSCCQFAV